MMARLTILAARSAWRSALMAALLAWSGPVARAGGVDIPTLQHQLNIGQAEEVRQAFDRAVNASPNNAHLLYNRAVAGYAAGRFEEALVDLDLVETLSPRALGRRARFQKGNAEFRLGLNASNTDVETTIARWKQSVAD